MKAVKKQRTEYETHVKETTKAIEKDREERKARRSLRRETLRAEKLQLESQIASLAEKDQLDQDVCKQEVKSIQLTADEFFSTINDQLERGEDLLNLLNPKEGVARNKTQHKDMLAHLFCPITHELMVDPVITDDGHTYERSAIQEYFQRKPTNQPTMSPATGLMLASRKLIPNVAIRSQCREFNDERRKKRCKRERENNN